MSHNGNDYNYSKEWNRLSQEPLTIQEETEINNLLAKRRGGIGMYDFAKQPESGKTNVLSALGIPQHRLNYPTLSFFGNVSWDSSLFDSHILFDNMHNWILESLRYLKGKPVNLVIRPHPGEHYTKFEPQIKTKDVIRDAGLTDDGVFIADGSRSINSYDLIDTSSAVVVYGSNVGLEAACSGKPVVTCANRHYRGKGFTLDPESRLEYENILDQIVKGQIPQISAEQVQLAKKYARMVFLLASHDLGHLLRREIEWDASMLEEGKDSVIDFLCNGILNTGSFVAESPLIYSD